MLALLKSFKAIWEPPFLYIPVILRLPEIVTSVAPTFCDIIESPNVVEVANIGKVYWVPETAGTKGKLLIGAYNTVFATALLGSLNHIWHVSGKVSVPRYCVADNIALSVPT